MGEELWNVGKVLDEKFDLQKFDLLIYSRKVGRQQIGSLSQEDRDLLTLRAKCTFDALSDICIHHEKKYIGRYQTTQRYCVNPFRTHGIQTTVKITKMTKIHLIYPKILIEAGSIPVLKH